MTGVSGAGNDLFCDPDAAESIDGDATVQLDADTSVTTPFVSGNAYNEAGAGIQIVLSTEELAPCSGDLAGPGELDQHRLLATIALEGGEPVLTINYAVDDGISTTAFGEVPENATINFDCPLSLEALAGDLAIGTTISGSFSGEGTELSASADFTLTYCGSASDSGSTGGSSSTG